MLVFWRFHFFLQGRSDRSVGFSHLQQRSVKDVALFTVQLLPALCSHLENCHNHFQVHTKGIDGDSVCNIRKMQWIELLAEQREVRHSCWLLWLFPLLCRLWCLKMVAWWMDLLQIFRNANWCHLATSCSYKSWTPPSAGERSERSRTLAACLNFL